MYVYSTFKWKVTKLKFYTEFIQKDKFNTITIFIPVVELYLLL